MHIHHSPAYRALFAHVAKLDLVDAARLRTILQRYLDAYQGNGMVIGSLTEGGLTVGDEIRVSQNGADHGRHGMVIAHLHVDGTLRHLYLDGERVFSVEATDVAPRSLHSHHLDIVIPLAERQKGRAV